MKFSVGNQKLGSNSFVTSRAVGDTCPTSCHYLNNGCYAQATEKRFLNARKIGESNLVQDWNLIRAMLLQAAKLGKSVRLQERGDFLNQGKLDKKYIAALTKACKSITDEGKKLPDIWVYTHVYNKSISSLIKFGIHVYASIHNKKDLAKAKQAGFTFFAFCDTEEKYTNSKMKKENIPKYIKFERRKYLVCPEQRLGRERVTCSGGKGTTACNYCIKQKGHVLFINH